MTKHKVVITIWSLWMKSLSVTIQMKTTEQYMYFPVVLLVMMYMTVLMFECVDEIL